MLCTRIRRRRSTSNNNNNESDKVVWESRKNIVITGVPDRSRRYLNDLYTTLIDIKWRWNLLFFVVGFVVTWVVFAVFYFLLCFLHGDLDLEHRQGNSTWTPCVENVFSFTEAYLFSIETMATIGYGWRSPSEECPGVYLAVMLQSVIGAGLQFALASLVVSKTRRANRRSWTILFSNTAVVYQEDSQFRLAVRIGDMRKGDVIGAHATGMLIKKTTAKEGHRVPVRMFTVHFDAESGRQKLFLCWPALLVHRVDQNSPLWSLSRDDLLNSMYELIVVLDGVAATTSKPFQARKSYHSREIHWGRRFRPLQISEDEGGSHGYVVNYDSFHDTLPVAIPLCSAQTLERRRIVRQLRLQGDLDSTEEEAYNEQEEIQYSEGLKDSCRGRVCSVTMMTADDAKSPLAVFSGTTRQVEEESGTAEESKEDEEQEAESAKFWATRKKKRAARKRSESSNPSRKASSNTLRKASANALRKSSSNTLRKSSSNTLRKSSSRKSSSSTLRKASSSTVRKASGSTIGKFSVTPTRKPSNTLHPDSTDSSPTKEAGINSSRPERPRKSSRVEFHPFPSASKSSLLQPQRRLSREDAVNMYRHRRSVTDTYLGTELPEEESDYDTDTSAAILSIVSQHSYSRGGAGGGGASGGKEDRRPDVRDVFKQRRKSVTLDMMFGTDSEGDY
ncbi:G protein-activated inward rectifier potassium channel 4-like [Littorina saxatilis]|uniref:Uncharacterized protein n=1 Tax=Littorina saxatilis TaxID=31220 RepID=A0AAN9GK41_9CAEN